MDHVTVRWDRLPAVYEASRHGGQIDWSLRWPVSTGDEDHARSSIQRLGKAGRWAARSLYPYRNRPGSRKKRI